MATLVYYAKNDASETDMTKIFDSQQNYAINEVEFADHPTCEDKLRDVLAQVAEEDTKKPVIFVCKLGPRGDSLVRSFMDKVATNPGNIVTANSSDFTAVSIPTDKISFARDELRKGLKIYALAKEIRQQQNTSGTIAVIFSFIFLILIVLLIATPKFQKPSAASEFMFLFFVVVFFVFVVSYSAF